MTKTLQLKARPGSRRYFVTEGVREHEASDVEETTERSDGPRQASSTTQSIGTEARRPRSRLDNWDGDSVHYALPIADPESNPEFAKALANRKIRRGKYTPDTLISLIGVAREVIMDFDGEAVEFTLVTPALDPEYFDVSFGPDWSVREEDDDSAKETLAMALASEVPVYPNNQHSAEKLATLHADLLKSGMRMRGSAGTDVVVKYVRQRAINIDSQSAFEGYAPSESVGPADVLLGAARQKLLDEQYAQASKVLANLQAGTSELRALLAGNAVTESALQRCLTSYPSLLGLDYARLIPKHRLGAEYEMDYALERHSGLIDLLEIEKSSDRLYNTRGDPTSQLVHAEQQVLDWLTWIEDHGSYASTGLGGLVSPAR